MPLNPQPPHPPPPPPQGWGYQKGRLILSPPGVAVTADSGGGIRGDGIWAAAGPADHAERGARLLCRVPPSAAEPGGAADATTAVVSYHVGSGGGHQLHVSAVDVRALVWCPAPAGPAPLPPS